MPAPLRRRTWTVVLLLLLMHAGAAGTTCPRARAGLCTRGFDLLTNLSWGQCCEACHRLGPSCAGVVYTPLGRSPIMSCYLKSQITGFLRVTAPPVPSAAIHCHCQHHLQRHLHSHR
jgi:hypothetical protein